MTKTKINLKRSNVPIALRAMVINKDNQAQLLRLPIMDLHTDYNLYVNLNKAVALLVYAVKDNANASCYNWQLVDKSFDLQAFVANDDISSLAVQVAIDGSADKAQMIDIVNLFLADL